MLKWIKIYFLGFGLLIFISGYDVFFKVVKEIINLFFGSR